MGEIGSVKWVKKDAAHFFPTLKKRVDGYFSSHQIKKQGNSRLYIKAAILLTTYITPFVVMLTVPLSGGIQLALWSLMGFALAGIGMSVMHDANHGAFSKNKFINNMMGYTLNMLGGSVSNWKMQHNVLHHTYTNVAEMDEDIDDKLMMRFCPHSERKPYHRFQFIYVVFFYSILTLYWVTLKDFVQFFQYRKHHASSEDKRSHTQKLIQIILMKIGYFFVFFWLPIGIAGLPVGITIWGFVIMQAIAGFILALIFQLAHTVEGTSHPLPNEIGVIENDWAMHQLQTTANFSRKNRFLSWYVGGLNFQVEHHLFPYISHVHYPQISEIVRATAEEHGVPYLENKTFFGAVSSHFRFLYQLGKA
ncbi:MAG: fatty acid desaturase [Candidatus Fluviicola riflensis]|nr:MAG: acyl-CoA desaturase [Candidatus Fluviicola riflensis]OGS77745.1 MAG: fatty acid desaturase [Candidatus Fluviicola riflensis]OGS84328.1 MAG: fatty acid desaturase [Fluviicola sp. RIFCSPHIGHO2_12_FULL_43_24]OGS84810.1 MAG: fatty acid desaturase [Fluviicola sp. RIFCSPHIGHO2_01_FULL_43_53]